jgi:hypothetical protein
MEQEESVIVSSNTKDRSPAKEELNKKVYTTRLPIAISNRTLNVGVSAEESGTDSSSSSGRPLLEKAIDHHHIQRERGEAGHHNDIISPSAIAYSSNMTLLKTTTIAMVPSTKVSTPSMPVAYGDYLSSSFGSDSLAPNNAAVDDDNAPRYSGGVIDHHHLPVEYPNSKNNKRKRPKKVVIAPNDDGDVVSVIVTDDSPPQQQLEQNSFPQLNNEHRVKKKSSSPSSLHSSVVDQQLRSQTVPIFTAGGRTEKTMGENHDNDHGMISDISRTGDNGTTTNNTHIHNWDKEEEDDAAVHRDDVEDKDVFCGIKQQQRITTTTTDVNVTAGQVVTTKVVKINRRQRGLENGEQDGGDDHDESPYIPAVIDVVPHAMIKNEASSLKHHPFTIPKADAHENGLDRTVSVVDRLTASSTAAEETSTMRNSDGIFDGPSRTELPMENVGASTEHAAEASTGISSVVERRRPVIVDAVAKAAEDQYKTVISQTVNETRIVDEANGEVVVAAKTIRPGAIKATTIQSISLNKAQDEEALEENDDKCPLSDRLKIMGTEEIPVIVSQSAETTDNQLPMTDLPESFKKEAKEPVVRRSLIQIDTSIAQNDLRMPQLCNEEVITPTGLVTRGSGAKNEPESPPPDPIQHHIFSSSSSSAAATAALSSSIMDQQQQPGNVGFDVENGSKESKKQQEVAAAEDQQQPIRHPTPPASAARDEEQSPSTAADSVATVMVQSRTSLCSVETQTEEEEEDDEAKDKEAMMIHGVDGEQRGAEAMMIHGGGGEQRGAEEARERIYDNNMVATTSSVTPHRQESSEQLPSSSHAITSTPESQQQTNEIVVLDAPVVTTPSCSITAHTKQNGGESSTAISSSSSSVSISTVLDVTMSSSSPSRNAIVTIADARRQSVASQTSPRSASSLSSTAQRTTTPQPLQQHQPSPIIRGRRRNPAFETSRAMRDLFGDGSPSPQPLSTDEQLPMKHQAASSVLSCAPTTTSSAVVDEDAGGAIESITTNNGWWAIIYTYFQLFIF